MDKSMMPKENDLFLVVNVDEFVFEIRYGYYEPSDRDHIEPIPIYPDLQKNPIYNREGFRIVTAVQMPCKHYMPPQGYEQEECCSSCIHYSDKEKEIDICKCPKMKLSDK